jgi:hypothetical protein
VLFFLLAVPHLEKVPLFVDFTEHKPGYESDDNISCSPSSPDSLHTGTNSRDIENLDYDVPGRSFDDAVTVSI